MSNPSPEPSAESLAEARALGPCCCCAPGHECEPTDRAVALAFDSIKRAAKIECYAGLARGFDVLRSAAKRSSRREALGQAITIAHQFGASYPVPDIAAALRALMEAE